MIKDIKDFPRLDAVQQYENGKEVIRMCNEGIREMMAHLQLLQTELDNNPFEHEQVDIINNMIETVNHMDMCIESRSMIESALKQLAPIYN